MSTILLTDCSARIESRKRLIGNSFFLRLLTPQTWLRSPRNFAKMRFGRFPTFHFSTTNFFFETSNGRLPPEDGSDRRQTSGKRVSGDPRHFIFRRHKHFLRPTFLLQNVFRQRYETFFSKVPVLEELCRFTHQCRMQLENSLPELSVSPFYDPWRRGKQVKNCFCREFGPQKTYTFSVPEYNFMMQ